MKGIVKKVFHNKGYGFVEGDNGKEFFFHQSGLEKKDFDRLTPGLPVAFDFARGPKGQRAVDIKILESAA